MNPIYLFKTDVKYLFVVVINIVNIKEVKGQCICKLITGMIFFKTLKLVKVLKKRYRKYF